MNSDFVDEAAEFDWMTRLSKETGRPVWFLLTDRTKDPERWKRLMAGVHAARAKGGNITAQVAGRPVGVIQGIAGSFNPFSIRPSYLPLEALSPQERLQRMRDPELRRRLLAEEPSERQLARLSQARQNMVGRWDKMFVMAGAAPDYEPTPEKSIAAIAARGNRSPQEVAYDYLTEGLDRFLFFPIVNYSDGDHDDGARDADRHRHHAGPQRRRRALRRHRRRQRALVHAQPLGPRPQPRAGAAACRNWSRCRPARPPISLGSTTAGGCRRDCAPTST